MLTIARLRPDGGERSYYERTVASSREDYYAGRGEAAGEWWGTGATWLGLAGEVVDGELSVVLQAVDPVSGVRLRTPQAARPVARTRIDPATGNRLSETVTHHPVAGFDLTFSAPKSVSLLYALGDAERQREVAEAHRAAWQDAMRLLETEACVVRSGAQGVIRERSGFVAAGYQHRTNRDGDPHLHTHVVVANMARAGDGRWRALDGQLFIRDWRHAAGYAYHARLRHELTTRLGVEWGPVVKGQADLIGVPQAVIDEFSRRRHAVVEHAAAHGSASFAGRERAQVITRPDKQSINWPTEVEQWRARAAEHGLGGREYTRLTPGGRAPRVPDARGTRADVLGVEGLTANGQTFTEADVVCAWAAAHPEGATMQDLRDHARATLEDPRVVRIGDARLGTPMRATTCEVLAREQEALAVAVRGRGSAGIRASETRVAREVASPVALTDEQARVARVAACSPDRVACVVGRAGAGKTTAIAAGARALQAEGIVVRGAAPSAQAAHTLAAAAGIEARTLHAILHDPRASLRARSVLVVDEASMADTRTLARVLTHAEERDARVVLVGDPAQLPAVGPGGLFAALCEREGAVRMDGNRRQQAEWERDALTDLRAGRVEDALSAYASHGRVAACEDPADTHARLVADWWDAAQAVGTGEAVMLAHRRTDVHALNHAARELLTAAGHLHGPTIDAGGREYQVGDHVIARTNDRRLGIRNSTRATVTDINPATGAITLSADDGAPLTVPREYAARSLDHAYALTVHAAQGATVTHAFILASDQARLAEWGYVALSRARDTTRIYILDTTDARPLGALEPARPGPTLDDLAEQLRRRAAEPLARDQLARPPRPPRYPPPERDIGPDL